VPIPPLFHYSTQLLFVRSVFLSAGANNGVLPTEPSQLVPYLKEPIDPAKVQKVLSQVPPGVTRLDQLEAILK